MNQYLLFLKKLWFQNIELLKQTLKPEISLTGQMNEAFVEVCDVERHLFLLSTKLKQLNLKLYIPKFRITNQHPVALHAVEHALQKPLSLSLVQIMKKLSDVTFKQQRSDPLLQDRQILHVQSRKVKIVNLYYGIIFLWNIFQPLSVILKSALTQFIKILCQNLFR